MPNTQLTLMNCLFDGNLANGSGGAIANIDGDVSIVNGTIVNNDASNSGEIVAATNAANTSFTNSILWDNGSQLIAPEEGGSFSITFSIVEGGFPGQGNINLDPLFVDPLGTDGLPSTGDEDFSLLTGSPAIDAANNNAIPSDEFDVDGDADVAEPFPTDMNRVPRFVDAPKTSDTGVGKGPLADMGAFEFQIESNGLLGDVNLDGLVNLLDVDPFIERISNGVFQAEADTNQAVLKKQC